MGKIYRATNQQQEQQTQQRQNPQPEDDSTEQDSFDWIPVSEAARLVPSPRRGKKTNIQTLIRWILDGKLTGWRRGRWWFVRRSEVLKVGRPSPPPVTTFPELPKERTKEEWDKAQAWARKVLSTT